MGIYAKTVDGWVSVGQSSVDTSGYATVDNTGIDVKPINTYSINVSDANGDQWYDVYDVQGVASISLSSGLVDILAVAGGGGGGAQHGGGGGAGGFFNTTTYLAEGDDFNITIGGGGAGGPGNASGPKGSDGSATAGLGVTLLGGGGGAGHGANQGDGKNGGSGGGACLVAGTGGLPIDSANGNAGGNQTGAGHAWPNGGAGGGGAGSAGQSMPNGTNIAGAGGSGKPSNISGSTVWYAGGGGGGSHQPNIKGPGGQGGGADGATGNTVPCPGDDAGEGLGGGGGGSGAEGSPGGNGGKGCFIFRVKVNAPSFETQSFNIPHTAYAARIQNGMVTNVVAIPDLGQDDDAITAYCNEHGLPGTWVDTSYTGSRRGKYAGVGDFFDPLLRNSEFTSPIVSINEDVDI